MRTTMLLLIMLLVSVGFAIAEEANDTYTNPTVGISVTKPADWHFFSAEQNLENLKRTKMKDDEFQRFLQLYATAPLVAMTKYPEPFDDLNPSLKVNIRPLGEMSGDNPVKIIELFLPQFDNLFEDFSVVEGPSDTVVSGMKAAYVRIHYSLQTQDKTEFPTCSELWIVPKGSFFFMIGAGTRQDEKTGKREEIAEILASLKIDKE